MTAQTRISSNGRPNKRQKRPPSLGPVARLENHVPDNWWSQIFNSTYLLTDADMVEDPAVTRAEVDVFIKAMGLERNHRILDLACGQGRHSIELARHGFTGVEGLDRSEYLIRRARKDARDAGTDVRFREGDVRRLPYPSSHFDRIFLAGNSFGYFQSSDDDGRVLSEAARVLKPDGVLLIDLADADFLRSNLELRSWEWVDKKHFVCRERSLSDDGEKLTTREIVTHTEQGVVVDQFYCERLYDRDALESALLCADFRDVEFHGLHEPVSLRDQDTGMMGHRLVVTGRVADRAAIAAELAARPTIRDVTVVMGDPRRKDAVKPGAVFDDDDFQTVNLLKLALSKVPGYRFDYADDHDLLPAQIAGLAGKADVVLNLCDEGFRNDALYELHVPALLEVAGVPYTGAGPGCLAYCYDKSAIRGIAREMGIPVAEAALIEPGVSTYDVPFGLPAIVKPNMGDSSIGITQASVVHTPAELAAAVERVRKVVGADRPVLVERFLAGKDISVGLIGNPGDALRVLPITEEDYSAVPAGLPRICGYEAKWDETSPYWDIRSVPADLAAEVRNFVIESCVRLFKRVGCRDYARFDWRLDGAGRPHLLEANPNPGWCWDGHLAKMCHIAGMSYPEMLGLILAAAERRVGMRLAEPGVVVHAPTAEAPTLDALMAF